MKYGLRYTVISIKTTVNITGMLCFQMMFSVDVLHKWQCACAYFTTFYHQFDSLFLIQFNLNNWCKKISYVFQYIPSDIFAHAQTFSQKGYDLRALPVGDCLEGIVQMMI